MKNEKLIIVLTYLCLLLVPKLIFATDGAKVDKNNTISRLLGEPKKYRDTEYGPIFLRNKAEDWKKNIDAVSGASISYFDDRIEDSQTWATEGSIIYPITRTWQRNNNDQESPVYTELALIPSIAWVRDTNRNELKFQLPVSYFVSHNIKRRRDTQGKLVGLQQWEDYFQLKPYYLTDFDFDGMIIGAELTYEPTIQIGSKFQIGSWISPFDESEVAYILHIIPSLNYSRVLSESSFINRKEHDDKFVIATHIELKFKPFGKKTPWEIGGEYKFLYDFSKDIDSYSNYWSTNAKWWFTKNIGMKLKYEKGNIPLTDKEVDLTTLSVEFRI